MEMAILWQVALWYPTCFVCGEEVWVRAPFLPNMAAVTSIAVQPEPIPVPRLSVIVPAHNNIPQLEECLNALRASAYPGFEIIVVDDCSTQDLRPVANGYGARYLRTPRNAGPAAARNLGAQSARGDVLVFVDSDVAVDRHALSQMSEDFLRNPQLAAVFGSYDDNPACNDFLSQHKNLMHHYIHQISKEHAISFWAGCGAVRKSVFLELGGFDAVHFPKPSIEDIELGYRMTRAGKKVLLDKRLQAKHLKRWTLSKLLHADIFDRAVPWARLILETRCLPRDLNLGYRARLSAVLVALLVASLLLLPFSVSEFRWVPGLIYPLLLIAATSSGLLVVNRNMYWWFCQRRGYWFTARVVLFHWLYYFYSGVAFAYCALTYRLSHAAPSTTKIATPAVDAGD